MSASSPDVEVPTERLIVRPMPPAAAARLPEDRRGAAALIGAALADEWPLADLLAILPAHARRPAHEAVFGIWVIVERETSTVVGDVGFMGSPDGEGVIEIGYSIVPSRRRRGFASEAVAALARWAVGRPGVTAVVAGTDAANAASQRVLERLGFVRTGEADGEVRWRLDRSEGGR